MKLDQLQHLVAIVEHGSLRGASRRLGVPQPALTRSIRSLERELNASLFLRETTGMVLTAMGRRFHVRASNIIHEARRAQDEISQHRGDDRGTVVVALSIMPHVGMLPHALKAFRERYPGVRLQIIEGLFPDVEGLLREGTVDFYLGAAPRFTPAPGLAMEKLFDNRRAVVCCLGCSYRASPERSTSRTLTRTRRLPPPRKRALKAEPKKLVAVAAAAVSRQRPLQRQQRWQRRWWRPRVTWRTSPRRRRIKVPHLMAPWASPPPHPPPPSLRLRRRRQLTLAWTRRCPRRPRLRHARVLGQRAPPTRPRRRPRMHRHRHRHLHPNRVGSRQVPSTTETRMNHRMNRARQWGCAFVSQRQRP